MLPWGSLAGQALRACTLQQLVTTTSLRNIKALFWYPRILGSLHRGKMCGYLFAWKIHSVYFVWANDGAKKLLHIASHQKYWLCMPSSMPHEVCVSAGAVVPVWWKLRSQQPTRAPCPCWASCLSSQTARLPVLTAAESAREVWLRSKWNGYLFAKQ